MYLRTYVRVCIYVRVCMYMCIYMYVCMYVYVCMYASMCMLYACNFAWHIPSTMRISTCWPYRDGGEERELMTSNGVSTPNKPIEQMNC